MKNPLDLLAETNHRTEQKYGTTVQTYTDGIKVARKNLRESAKAVRSLNLDDFVTGDHMIDADILVPTVKALERAGMDVSTFDKDGKTWVRINAKHQTSPAELIALTKAALS